MRLWQSWVGVCSRREGGESLALVRILVPLVLLWDLGQVARFELVAALWAPVEAGGMGPALHSAPHVAFYEWFGASLSSTYLLYAATCLSAVALCLGLCTRTSALVLLLSYGQLAQLSPDADRGVDTLLRNALFVLVFADAGATLSLDAWRRCRTLISVRTVLAFPRYLIIAQLVLLYFCAGIAKSSPNWSYAGGYAALFYVLEQPHYSSFAFSHAQLVALYPLLQAGAAITVLWERAAALLPLLLWLRATASRRGPLALALDRTRLLEGWVALGVSFHLALALLLNLGLFPWGCLALYPALARPATLRSWAGRLTTRRDALAAASDRRPMLEAR